MKNRIFIFLLLFAVIALNLSLSSCTSNPKSIESSNYITDLENDKHSTTKETESLSNYEKKLLKNITVGMTYKEIVDFMGDFGTEVGYGAIIMEWNLKTGRELLVHFYQSDAGDYIATSVIID